jgi:hypothetical protein
MLLFVEKKQVSPLKTETIAMFLSYLTASKYLSTRRNPSKYG